MKGDTALFQPQLYRSKSIFAVVAFGVLLIIGTITFLSHVSNIGAAADLTVEIIAAHNLVVDSNVESPSTFAPSVATVAGRFCNVGDTSLTDVQGYIGDGIVPGNYPTRSSGSGTFDSDHPHLVGSGSYAFTHVGGRLGTADASRYIGTIPPGECRLQYWHFTYPQCENDAGNVADLPPCEPGNDPVWGRTNVPEDDLWLRFDIWGDATGETGGGANNSASRIMTMRNEISAMANKIRPNPDGRWFNTNTSQVLPGDVITSNGILYTLGNVRHGFDNNGDYVPDYNAWLQPIGDPNYDPSCFRLIRTSGVLTVSRGGSPDLIIPFNDNDPALSAPYGGPLYFTNLPDDNTAVDGQVYYTFLALDGPCNTGLSPYQEVASGYDNEKFNGDYGTGIPPVVSLEPAVTIDKSSNPNSVLVGQQFSYEMPVANTGSAGAGLPLSTGGGGMPLVVSDTIPTGLEYVAGTASFSTSQTGLTASILFSTDNGATWASTEPVPANTVTTIQWWFNDTFDPSETATTSFDAQAPVAPSTGVVENCADTRFGDGVPFAEACAITVIQGNNQIGDFVWQDENGDGVQDGGELGIDNVTISLYWDRNGDGLLDSDDPVITSTQTTGGGGYSFDNLPDGNYLVIVDDDDSDIPFGYSNTTATIVAVDLDSGSIDPNPVIFSDADFGFGPVLALDKQLISSDPASEGDAVTYTIDLINTRPGDGRPEPQYCQYTLWATIDHPDNTMTPPGGNNANSQWANTTNALNAPDGLFASTNMANTPDELGLSGFNMTPQLGNITNVSIINHIREDVNFRSVDQYFIRVYSGDAQLGPDIVYNGDSLTGTVNTPYTIITDVTSFRAWTWSDFSGNMTEMQVEGNAAGGNPNGEMSLDAAAYIITTDMICNDPDATINPLPLVDTYDADKLQFVSASPTASSVTTGGVSPYANTGTISWDNLGPLYAGQTTSVTVTFLALEPPDIDFDGENDPTTITNTAAVLNATFTNGRPTNQITDTVTATLNPTGSIGDTIWNDNGGPAGTGTGSNGVQDGDEQGIPGVTVYLCATSPCNSGSAIDTAVTDVNGNYLFEGVADGSYFVGVDTNTLPGSSFTQTGDPDEVGACTTCDNEGSTTLNNNDGNPANDDDVTLDFGYTIPNVIFGNVWEDNDGDGSQEAGENGIAGVTVFLDDCGANAICGDGDDGPTISTTTDANGDYVFGDVPDGNYRVRVDAGNAPLGPDWNQTADPDEPGQCVTCDDQTSAIITVSGGNIYGPYDFAYTQTGNSNVGDTIYTDWDGDGVEDAGEEGIANVTVYLYEDANGDGVIDPDDDALVDTQVTDGTGFYEFTGLAAGNFIVVVDEDDPDLPDNYVQTGDPDEGAATCSVCDGQALVTTDGSTDIDTVDMGYQPIGSSSIGDTVFQDNSRNGLQDAGEPGLPDILVTLYEDSNNDGIIDAGDAVVGTTTTDSEGNYLFSNLPAGNYLVEVNESDTDLPTDAFGMPYILSTGGNPIDVTLGADEEYLDADFGFTAGGVIGDYIWQDNNGDGQPDNVEPGINGVTVQLWEDSDGNGTPDTLLDTEVTATDPATGNDGYYEFAGLPAGDYVVVVSAGVPAGFNQTGDPDENSPPACTTCDEQSALNLAIGQVDRSRDFGYQPAGVIGDTLWIDGDGDGVRDENEAGIPGITVELVSASCTEGSDCPTVETDENGYYSFGDLPDGNYTVVVDQSDPDFPTGLTLTYDPDEANPCSTCDERGNVTITGGSIHLDIDFGYQFNGTNSIAGTAFHDDNDNATQDLGETSTYSNVPVYLWNCGADATCMSGVTFVGTMMTDGSGDYLFDNLADGNYLVSVNANAPAVIETDPTVTTGTPTTYHTVTLSGPNDDVIDQDFGFLSSLDLGDLPDSYRTSLANDGPSHIVTNTLFLGASVAADLDVDANGQAEANAGRLTGGDDGDGTDDEDGVNALSNDEWGDGSGTIEVDVVGTGCLIGWVDWNDSGTFDAVGTVGGVSEILVNEFVTTGANQQFLITSPTTAQFQAAGFPGYNTEMFFRFRLFPPYDARFGNMAVDGNGCPTAVSDTALISLSTGRASAGEVEDYEWLFHEPTAVTLTNVGVTFEKTAFNFVYLLFVLLMVVSVSWVISMFLKGKKVK